MITITIHPFDLKSIAQSGQCFRLTQTGDDRFTLVAHGRVLRVRALGDNRFAFDCDGDTFERVWRPYFDIDTDYDLFLRSVPAEDGYLTRAAAFGGGIRILRQDPWETLVTFILSQRKNIPAIRRSVELLCRRFGAPLGDGHHAFPTPQALLGGTDEALSACALGYRCAYVRGTARMVADGTLDLSALASLEDAALHQALLSAPGVGPKVANCVMLFGFHRIGAFPRDVWINRIVDGVYGGDFPLHLYEGYAGVMQQYLFHYARLGEARDLAK